MNQQFFFYAVLLALEIFLTSATMLPPRLSTAQKTIKVKEGETKVVLECSLDVGDDPVAYRWLKQYKLVTADLGFAYRTYRKVHLALHTITPYHEGIYECEAANDAGVNAMSIEVIVERGDFATKFHDKHEIPDTSVVLSDFAISLNDLLAEGNCECDVMFLLHASAYAPRETLEAQGNFVHTIAHPIISSKIRVSAITYSDYANTKFTFGKGTDRCALKEGLKYLIHERWTTRIQPVLRDALKKFRKSKKECKILFLPIFGSLGTEGPQNIVANHLKKSGVKIMIMEVTDAPIVGVQEMASKRGDDKPYHWWIPLKIWPTIISYMKYMQEELTGCTVEHNDIPGVCVEEGQNCTQSKQCLGIGFGCLQGVCKSLECNIHPNLPGCCLLEEVGDFWCGDVSLGCKDRNALCDGKIQCMNGEDEERCWKTACGKGEARCQSSTLCLSMYDLCDGEPHCPGAEDEDPVFCRSFPCPLDRTFRCRSGKCIATEQLCDGTFKDCADGEDENLEYCSEKHVCPSTRPFKCDYGICIAERMVCDGAFNCLDALDERLCDDRNCPAERPFKCGDGKCVDLSMICNGVVDACSDGSDENNCTNFSCPSERSIKCRSGRCIDKWLRCDGRNDCGDNTDEENCDLESTTLSSTTFSNSNSASTLFPKPTKVSCLDDQFYCTSGACLSLDKICDGRRNCIDGEDEDPTMCAKYPCPKNRSFRCPDDSCVKVLLCDGIPDCSDGSDEKDCNLTILENPEADREMKQGEQEHDEETLVEDVKPAASSRDDEMRETHTYGGSATNVNLTSPLLYLIVINLIVTNFR